MASAEAHGSPRSKRARVGGSAGEASQPLFEGPFAVLQRSCEEGLLYLAGELEELDLLDQIPLPADGRQFQSISMVPFCQISERGFKAHSEGEKILSIRVKEQTKLSLQEVLDQMPPEEEIDIEQTEYDTTEEAYEEILKSIIFDQVYNGEGSSFVSPRTCNVTVRKYSLKIAFSVFRRLLVNEYGTYWTFIFHAGGEHCFVGASPERQLMVSDGEVRMNPISGTFRKSDVDIEQLRGEFMEFLKDQKEIDELFMVTDEELKMMARLCPEGGSVIGPRLIEMGFLVHTEYELVGSAARKRAIDLFRHTMFCPTVTGSPMGNACRVVHGYEKNSRRYYSSAIVLMGWDADEQEYLDSAITIRTIEMQRGRLQIRAGATITRDSDPRSEVLETIAKQRGALNAVQNSIAKSRKPLPRILSADFPPAGALEHRNREVCKFWLQHNYESADEEFRKALTGKKVVLLENEDDFVWMVSHLFSCHGAKSVVVPFDEFDLEKHAKDAWLVVLGPGPGDPNGDTPKMRKLFEVAESLFKARRRTLGVCLGHQVICRHLGFKVPRKEKPLQGVQKIVNLFGTDEKVGFYNSFCPLMDAAVVKANPDITEVATDGQELIAVRGNFFATFQFHPESILTQRADELIGRAIDFFEQCKG
eukprot:TRINITY_DN56089_c0_g1_i1.p1 TRINITY_DN56089_c0_g1~~TRINITY_DN56089_c0_g1_i1.p1  ORF type:complete len:647 (-),score=108.84 TRINITY_DN56089_c0_g1_i1:34-1974(-)